MCVSTYWVCGAQVHVKFPAKDLCVFSEQTNKGLLSWNSKLVCTENTEPLHLCLYAVRHDIPVRQGFNI